MNEVDKKEINDLLQRLIQIKSVNPPGNESEIAVFIKEVLLKNNITSELVPLEEGRSSVVAKIVGKEERNITLCGHLDTVRVKEEDWTKPPFQGLIENGRMYGRGAADMKGGVTAILYAAVLLKRRGIIPKKTIQLALTADEEWGYRGAKNLVDGGYFDRTDFLIISEPTNLQVSIGEKGEVWIKAKFFGKSAHGSTPELGRNTVIPGSKFILEVSDKYEKTFKKKNLWGKTSINIGQFHGGEQINIVPNYSEVQLDFRVISEEDKGRAIELVRKIGNDIAEKYEIQFLEEIFNYHPPIFTSLDNLYIQKFMQVAGVKEATIVKYCTDGGTIIPEKKVPFIIFGPGDIAQAHQNDEYIELESLYRAVDTFVEFLT
ncbi:MAG: M20 family metallopeptidase [Atribacteria sp.]|nr:M20 family metallopeptidase [Candidatus Atribacteria bacterium]MBU4047806.1 M20 family metallopeptidase [bacterium]